MLITLALLVLPHTTITSAQASTRTLKLYYTHTKERTEITFKRNGRYDKDGLRKLNNFLRDWRRNEPTKMDPALFDLLWEVYQKTGSNEYIHVVSAYRSLKTNNMLRSRSSGVAKNSQHTQGRAIDFFIPGVSTAKLRALGLREHMGGVGYYPRSNTPFVHMDTGSVRHWPRMTRAQLAKVFPNGKTIHVPTDGKPMKGYKQALAEIKARQSGKSTKIASSSSRVQKPSDRVTRNSEDTGSFFSRLFTNSAAPNKSTPTPKEQPTHSLETADHINTIPQPKIALVASQQASSPIAGELLPQVLTRTPSTKPRMEAKSHSAQTKLTLLASAHPRAKPKQFMQPAHTVAQIKLPAATPKSNRAHPVLPTAIAPPEDGISAIAAATGAQTPTSLRPLINAQLAYAPPASAPSHIGDKFNKQTALSTQALFTEQRTPDLTQEHPRYQNTETQIDSQSHTTIMAAIPQAGSYVMLDATPTAENRKAIRMQHPDQVHIQSLFAVAQSMLRQPFTQRPYLQNHTRINRGPAIAWLDTVSTSGLILH